MVDLCVRGRCSREDEIAVSIGYHHDSFSTEEEEEKRRLTLYLHDKTPPPFVPMSQRCGIGIVLWLPLAARDARLFAAQIPYQALSG
jgi:hypothetical protein